MFLGDRHYRFLPYSYQSGIACDERDSADRDRERKLREDDRVRFENPVKFIRLQTDVNLFKLCDLGWQFIVAHGAQLYLLYSHCRVATGEGRDGCGSHRKIYSILRYNKK